MAAARPKYNTKDIAKVKAVDENQVAEVKQWMEAIMEEQYADFFDDIRDGVELCKLLNKIKPDLISAKKFKKSKIVFVARTNIQLFIEGCKKLGIPETDCFETRDLFDQQNLANVVQTMYAVSAISRKHNFQGPFIGKKYAEANKRNFTAEQLAKSKSAVPMMAKGGIAHKTKGMDGYGIVKTDKDMQKPSQVQGAWQKGANKQENKGMDGYGIVKTDKDMQKPSQVQGAWQKGGVKQDNKGGMDGYGIVKVADDMQKPSNEQGAWQQGGVKQDNKGMDSYGIVKVADDMQNPSNVQGVMQQGGVKQDDKGGMDSYGIVKTNEQ